MKITTTKLAFRLILFLLAGLNHAPLNAREKLPKQHIVELEKNCILKIDSKFDSSVIAVKDLEAALIGMLTKMQTLIPVDSLTINVKWAQGEELNFVIKDMAVGGKAEDDYEIKLLIDPENTNFKYEYLFHALAHETHHAIRARITGMWSNLLESFVFEGLAPLFQMETVGGDRPFFTSALDETETVKYMEMSEPYLLQEIDFDAPNNLYMKWFFNSGADNQIPFFTGFSIGWQIVQNYIQEHPGATAANLIGVSAEQIAASTFDMGKLLNAKR